MHKIIKDAVASKRKIYFVSPHLDDAILSAGDLISYLGPRTDVTIINVFTSVTTERPTLSAEAFTRKCGYSNIADLYKERIREDADVITATQAKRINLGFIDAMWRQFDSPVWYRRLLGKILPEFTHLYPTYRFNIKERVISPADEPMITKLVAVLNSHIQSGSLVLCPLSLGNHVDHIIVRAACERLGVELIYWTDYPYLLEVGEHELAELPHPPHTFTFSHNKKSKQKLISGYGSQQGVLFDGEVPVLADERYFYNEIPDGRLPTVSIGIPAYNEDQNIKYLLGDILSQSSSCYQLKEIIVLSDGSTDNTNKDVKAFEARGVTLLAHSLRQGLATTENDLFSAASGDICILLQADIRLFNNNSLDLLVAKMSVDQADLVAGNLTPSTASSWFGKITVIGALWKHATFSLYHNGLSLFTCYGPIRAFSSRLYKQIKFRHSVGEDMYSYLYARKYAYKYSFASSAVATYHTPDNFKDHLAQSLRFFRSTDPIRQMFPNRLMQSECQLPRSILLETSLQFLWYSPFNFIGYLITSSLISIISIFSVSFGVNNTWGIATSSKQVKV